MTFNFRKALLAGTALVAVAGFVAPAQAQTTLTLSGAATWGTDGGNGMVNTPTAGDNVTMGANNLTFDTSETGVLTAGALTSTGGDLIVNTTGNAGSVAFTVGSFTGTGTSDVTLDNLNASTNRNVALNVTGALSTAGNVLVQNTEVGGSNTSVTLTVGGNYTTTGTATTNVTTNGTGQTNTTAVLDLNGATNTFAGAVTITGGAAAASNTSSLLISGASTTFTGGLTLTNGAAGAAILTMDGLTNAQNVAGTIGGTGTINVANAADVTFTGAVTAGSIVIENGGAALNSSATFRNTVSAPITLGGAGTGTNTVTFDGTTAGFTVTGAINGAAAGETNNIVFTNSSGAARTIVQATAIGGGAGNVDNLTVSGTGTTLDSNAAITTTGAVTVGSGAILDAGGIITTTTGIVNNGTLRLTGAVTHVNTNLTGTGLLDVDASTTVVGAITQGTVDIAAVTLTRSAAAAYTVGTTNFSGAGTLALVGGAQTIGGNFTNTTTTTTGDGIITITDVAGTTAFTGNLGDSATDRLASVSVAAGANAAALTTTGNWHVAATTIGQGDSLQFLGTSPQTVSGTIVGTGANLGAILVGGAGTNSDVTFNGALGGTALLSSTVAAGSTARYNANATYGVGGTYTNNGTTRVAQGATLTAANFTNAGSYFIGVVDANGTLAASDFARMTDSAPGSTIDNSRMNIVLSGDIGTGTATSVLTGITLNTPGVLADNSIQYTFTAANAAGNTNITVAKATAASLATSPNSGVGTVLDTLTANTNTQIAAIVDSLATASTQDAFNEVLEAVAPNVDGGAIVGGFNASVQSMDVANTRLASLRDGVETGMVAGETSSGLEGWIQGFGQVAQQDRRDAVDGYDADTYGVAVGLDTADMLDHSVVGVALSYANTEVDSENATRTNSDVDSYQVSLYGDFDVAPQTYVSGNLGFAWNDIDQTRFNVGGISGLTANADYDSNQYIAYLEAGREFDIAEKTTFTPHVMTHYQHITIDDYNETGAGGANLNVDSDDLNILEFGVGAELAWDLQDNAGAKVRPALSAGYRHDVIGDNVQSTSTLSGGGASFKTEGFEPADGTFNVGAGLSYEMPNNWTVSVDYDYEIKSDYDAHSGFVRAGYKF